MVINSYMNMTYISIMKRNSPVPAKRTLDLDLYILLYMFICLLIIYTSLQTIKSKINLNFCYPLRNLEVDSIDEYYMTFRKRRFQIRATLQYSLRH